MERINRIKVVLAEKQKTNKWLAEQLGKNTTTVSKWCIKSSQLDIQTFAKIAEMLEVSMDKLLIRSSIKLLSPGQHFFPI